MPPSKLLSCLTTQKIFQTQHNRKNGNRYLSWAFIETAHHAIRHCDPGNRFYQRKMAKTNGALATKALASKLLKAAYYILTAISDSIKTKLAYIPQTLRRNINASTIKRSPPEVGKYLY